MGPFVISNILLWTIIMDQLLIYGSKIESKSNMERMFKIGSHGPLDVLSNEIEVKTDFQEI